MKFVKGDAIAGIIIIVVNLIGGLSIGIVPARHGRGRRRCNLYALLTIGDGLVAQIPALFISITAGFIVTRVASEDNNDLGSDIAGQLINQPKGLMITATILAIFAVVPGFPWHVFTVLAAIVGSGGYYMSRKQKRASASRRSSEMPSLASDLAAMSAPPTLPDDKEDTTPIEPVNFALTVPLIVDIAATVRNSIRPDKLDREVARVRRALYFDLGVPFPGIHLRLNENLKDGEYRILVNEMPVAAGLARPGFVIVRETESNLAMFNIPFERGQDFLPNTPSLWVSTKHLPILEKAGIQVMTLSSMLTYHLAHILKSHAPDFIGVQETMFLINQMQKNFAELVREVTRLLPITTITDVMQRLVSEEISIRDLRTVLEALVTWGQREKDAIILSEHVRGALSRYITHKFSGGQNILPAYLISKEIEDAVRGAIRQTSGASYLALSPDIHRELVASIKTVVGDTRQRRLRGCTRHPGADGHQAVHAQDRRAGLSRPGRPLLSGADAEREHPTARTHQDGAAKPAHRGRMIGAPSQVPPGGARRTGSDSDNGRLRAYLLLLIVAFTLYCAVNAFDHDLRFFAACGAILAALVAALVLAPANGRAHLLVQLSALCAGILSLVVPLAGEVQAGRPLAVAIVEGPVWPQILVLLFAARVLAEACEMRFAALWQDPLSGGSARTQSMGSALLLGSCLTLIFYQLTGSIAIAPERLDPWAIVVRAFTGTTVIHVAIVLLFFVVVAAILDAALLARQDSAVLRRLRGYVPGETGAGCGARWEKRNSRRSRPGPCRTTRIRAPCIMFAKPSDIGTIRRRPVRSKPSTRHRDT